MGKMFVIDSEKREIREEPYKDLSSLQGAVGGYIETAYNFPNDDAVFVNEEGLYQGYEWGFMVKGAHQPFLGNGVVVGTDAEGNTVDPKMSLQELKSVVKFVSLDDIRRMFSRSVLKQKSLRLAEISRDSLKTILLKINEATTDTELEETEQWVIESTQFLISQKELILRAIERKRRQLKGARL